MAYRVVLRHGPKVAKHDADDARGRARRCSSRGARDRRRARAARRSTCACARFEPVQQVAARAELRGPAACARASTSAATAPPRRGPAASAARSIEPRDGEDAYAALRRVLSSSTSVEP